MCASLFLTSFTHSSWFDLVDSALRLCITAPEGGGDVLIPPTCCISDVNMLWKFRHLNARRQQHTFVRRLFSSCGWSLTTSPSCWAAAFRVTGVVPVSSRINSRSSLKTGNKTRQDEQKTTEKLYVIDCVGSTSQPKSALLISDSLVISSRVFNWPSRLINT